MKMVIKSDYGGKVRDFYEQQDGSFRADDGTILPMLPPDPPPREMHSPLFSWTLFHNASRRMWLVYRACIWTIFLCSLAGLLIHFAPLIWGFVMENPIGVLVVLCASSAALLIWSHYD